MSVNKTLHNMDHSVDPKQTVLDAVGDIYSSEIMEISACQVLIGTYVRPEKTAGGLLQAAITRREDEYQGKVGLILKMGPMAFHFDSEESPWPIRPPREGDWVVYRVHDGFMTTINGHPCRFLEDLQIRAIIRNPDLVL